MSYEKLTSDKVNYLIWRYLQEAGFGQTAARLQLDWGLQHHPDDLSFAKHIGPRSMIKLMHYGLKLHRIQTSEKPNAPRFFGPDHESTAATETVAPATNTTTNSTFTAKSSSPSRRLETGSQAASSAAAATTTTTTTTTTAAPQPPPPSGTKPRNRRSNGTATNNNAIGKPRGTGENMDVDQSGATTDTAQDNEMEIDENNVQQKRPADETIVSISSPVKNGEPQQNLLNGMDIHGSDNRSNQEQQPIPSPLPISTLTNGVSIGIQPDTVIELAPTTYVLNTSSIRSNTLSLAEWSPSESATSPRSLLAVGGKQMGQIWEINRELKRNINQATSSISATAEPTVEGPTTILSPENVVKLDVASGYSLVSLAWNSQGDQLAYSIFADSVQSPQRNVIKVRIRSTCEDFDTFTPTSEPVTNLVWNEQDRFIVGIAGPFIVMLDTKSGTQLQPLDVGHSLFDITWLDKDTLAVCGVSYIAIISLNGNSINVRHAFADFAGSTEWTQIRYDAHLRCFAVASETAGDLVVIHADKAYKESQAHSSPITAMIYQPVLHLAPDQPRILVTSSTDGSVKVWNTRSGVVLAHALFMGGISQALNLAFSPDGNILAVADWDKVLFWDIRQSIHPKYKWELRRVDWQSLPNGHISNGTNHVIDSPMEETDDEPPILTWNGPDHCLTFAHKDKMAIIQVPI